MAKLIDGKVISAAVKAEVAEEVAKLKEQGITTGLAVIIVGEDPASKVYVANKEKACEATGMASFKYALPEETTEEEILKLIKELNEDSKVNGILCQLPLPRHLDEELILALLQCVGQIDLIGCCPCHTALFAVERHGCHIADATQAQHDALALTRLVAERGAVLHRTRVVAQLMVRLLRPVEELLRALRALALHAQIERDPPRGGLERLDAALGGGRHNGLTRATEDDED